MKVWLVHIYRTDSMKVTTPEGKVLHRCKWRDQAIQWVNAHAGYEIAAEKRQVSQHAFTYATHMGLDTSNLLVVSR